MKKVVVSYSGGYGVHMPANGTNNVSLCLLGVINPGVVGRGSRLHISLAAMGKVMGKGL
jgi:hypothetical protein